LQAVGYARGELDNRLSNAEPQYKEAGQWRSVARRWDSMSTRTHRRVDRVERVGALLGERLGSEAREEGPGRRDRRRVPCANPAHDRLLRS
jgi:hypothetical protein